MDKDFIDIHLKRKKNNLLIEEATLNDSTSHSNGIARLSRIKETSRHDLIRNTIMEYL